MSADAEIIHGELPIIIEGPDPVFTKLGELDTCSARLLVRWATWSADAAELGFVLNGAFPGFGGMFVGELRPRRNGTLAFVDVDGIGVIGGGQKRKRSISCGSQQVAVGPVEKVILAWSTEERGEDGGSPVDKVKRRVTKVDSDGEPEYKLIVTPSGAFDRWNIGQGIVGVEDMYFTTSLPSTSVVGQANTPPSAPGVPAYPWGGLETLRGQHPNGWVLVDRRPDEILPGFYAVVDRWEYFFAAVPD